LYWVEAIDGGDPAREARFRDQVFYLVAPFDGKAVASFQLERRFSGISWGNDDFALLTENWRRNRRSVTYAFSPVDNSSELRVVFDRSTDDRYNDPGRPQLRLNELGNWVLQFDSTASIIYLSGMGASPEGNRPFLDAYNVFTGETNRLWQSEAPWYETTVRLLDADRGLLITRRESNEVNPNFYLRNIFENTLIQLTDFPDPFTALQKLHKEVIHYERADGIALNGTLYLPPGFEPGKDIPLPTLLWAYPREFKSSDAAGQVSGSPYTYSRIGSTSPVMLATQGFAVLENASFPIVGEGDDEPNDTFIDQLIMNAEAAIAKLVEMGVSDPSRMAVSGHSYGAFMTANLLAHSDLFATGIARSGAYNRSLTPFGFQGEERTYWQAADTYNAVSPFMHADKIKVPILLIHGADDNNSGTFPLQSERFYDALRGHGATARLVMLPHESHGYRARESVLHMHWEWLNWLEKYLK
jgi:dipeptidyl aminopeptidase/acylaminoacyl peptidase